MDIQQMFEGIRNGTPQCEVRSHEDGQCEWASAVRVHAGCSDCGHVSPPMFMCPGHTRGLAALAVLCYYCKSPNVWVRES